MPLNTESTKQTRNKLSPSEKQFAKDNPNFTYSVSPTGKVVFHNPSTKLDFDKRTGKVVAIEKPSGEVVYDVKVEEKKVGEVKMSKGFEEKYKKGLEEQKQKEEMARRITAVSRSTTVTPTTTTVTQTPEKEEYREEREKKEWKEFSEKFTATPQESVYVVQSQAKPSYKSTSPELAKEKYYVKETPVGLKETAVREPKAKILSIESETERKTKKELFEMGSLVAGSVVFGGLPSGVQKGLELAYYGTKGVQTVKATKETITERSARPLLELAGKTSQELVFGSLGAGAKLEFVETKKGLSKAEKEYVRRFFTEDEGLNIEYLKGGIAEPTKKYDFKITVKSEPQKTKVIFQRAEKGKVFDEIGTKKEYVKPSELVKLQRIENVVQPKKSSSLTLKVGKKPKYFVEEKKSVFETPFFRGEVKTYRKPEIIRTDRERFEGLFNEWKSQQPPPKKYQIKQEPKLLLDENIFAYTSKEKKYLFVKREGKWEKLFEQRNILEDITPEELSISFESRKSEKLLEEKLKKEKIFDEPEYEIKEVPVFEQKEEKKYFTAKDLFKEPKPTGKEKKSGKLLLKVEAKTEAKAIKTAKMKTAQAKKSTVALKPKIKQEYRFSYRSSFGLESIELKEFKQEQKYAQIQLQKRSQEFMGLKAQKSSLNLKSFEETKQIQPQPQVQKILQSEISRKKLMTAQIPKPKPRSKKKLKLDMKTKTKKRRFFDVLVRKKGKFVKATEKPLTEQTALGFGEFIVERSPLASFKLKESSMIGDVKKNYSFSPQKFYKKGDIYIEKPKYRINTPQELTGITKKGLKVRRMKKWTGSLL